MTYIWEKRQLQKKIVDSRRVRLFCLCFVCFSRKSLFRTCSLHTSGGWHFGRHMPISPGVERSVKKKKYIYIDLCSYVVLDFYIEYRHHHRYKCMDLLTTHSYFLSHMNFSHKLTRNEFYVKIYWNKARFVPTQNFFSRYIYFPL